jgi:hypothetical protein
VTEARVTRAIRVGGYALEIGTDSASFAQFDSEPENDQARALGAALDQAQEGEPALVRAIEELNESATAVAKKIERAQALSRAAVEGQLLQPDALAAEIDGLLGLLTHLDRAGRFEDELRLARALHGLLVVSLRWLDLVRSLRGALRSARAIGDQNGQAWALHELGTLDLCTGNLERAEKRFQEALRIQNELQAAGWCATRHNLDCARRDRFAGPPGHPTRTQPPRGALARVLAVLGVKGIAILILLIAAGSTAAGVALTGHPGTLQPKFNRTTLSFGASKVAETSPPQTLLLHAGSKAVSVGPLSVGHPGEFLTDNSCPTRLAARATCAIDVRFRPSVAGQRSTVLKLALGTGKALNAQLLGSGTKPIQPALAPATLNLGEVDVGARSGNRALTLTAGSKQLTIIRVVSNASEFRTTNHCPRTLAAGSSCRIEIAFAPTSPGTRSATLTVEVSRPDPLRSGVTGVGVLPPTIRPPRVNFGHVVVGSRQMVKIQVLAGSKPLTAIGVRTNNPREFPATSSCPSQIGPQASCAIAVTFAPRVAGSRKGVLTISFSNRPPFRVPLTGVGIEAFIRLDPTSLDFGSVAADMPDSTTKDVRLTNTGSAPLTITNITSSDRQFSVKSGCPVRLAVGQSCVFSVRFNPSAIGHHSATITIVANGHGQHTLLVSGEGVVG